MDVLAREVVEQLGRGVAGVQLDLVDGGDDLFEKTAVSISVRPILPLGQESLGRGELLTVVLSALNSFSRFLMAKLLTPMARTLPVPTSFCISRQVSTKSQPGKCFFLSSGSVEDGQCTRYKST